MIATLMVSVLVATTAVAAASASSFSFSRWQTSPNCKRLEEPVRLPDDARLLAPSTLLQQILIFNCRMYKVHHYHVTSVFLFRPIYYFPPCHVVCPFRIKYKVN